MNSPSEISVGVMARSANRGELTLENGGAAELAWFDAQLTYHDYVRFVRSVGEYLHQLVRGRATLPSCWGGVRRVGR